MKDVKLAVGKRYVIVGQIQSDYVIGYSKFKKQVVPVYDKRIWTWMSEMAKERISHRFDCPILIAGRRRTGKSLNATQIARHIDPDFPHENVAFSLDDFINIINRLPPSNPKTKKYSCAILDEAGASLFAHDWAQTLIKQASKVMQIVGRKQLILFFVLPHRNLLIGTLRDVPQFWVTTLTLGEERGFAELRVASERDNPWVLSQFYRGLAGYVFPEVNDKWWQEYEKKKDDYIQDFTGTAANKMEGSRAQKVTAQRDALLRLIWSMKSRPTQEELSKLTNINRTTISHVLNPTSAASPTPSYTDENNIPPHNVTTNIQNEPADNS